MKILTKIRTLTAIFICVLVALTACSSADTAEQSVGTSDTQTAAETQTTETKEAEPEKPAEQPTAEPEPEPTKEPEPEPTKEPELKQIVVSLRGEREDGYDPTYGWGRYGSPLFQSTLLKRDTDLNIVNDVATGYEISEDGLTWTIGIRDDVLFSDGEALEASDVAYTYLAAKENGGLADLTALESATAIDATTVELKLEEPNSTFVNKLTTLGIVPEHAHDDNYAQNPIGSGPYKMLQWDKGQQLIVEANELYYNGKPDIDRVTFLFLDEEASFAAAKAGQLHAVTLPPALAKEEFANMELVAVDSVDNRGIMLPTVPNTGETTEEGLEIGNDVTAHREIRQAINYSIDRQALVEGVLEGFGSPAFTSVDGLPWEQPEGRFQDGDPEAAKAILEEAGWEAGDDGVYEKDGLRATFKLVYPSSDSTRQALALASADMIKKAGIDVELVGQSWDDIKRGMHSNGILFGWGSHDQAELYELFNSSSAGVGWSNTGFYANDYVDEAMENALRATDEDTANKLWSMAQYDPATGAGVTGNADAPWAWLVNLDHIYFTATCLDIGPTQVEPHGHGWPITQGIANWKSNC